MKYLDKFNINPRVLITFLIFSAILLTPTIASATETGQSFLDCVKSGKNPGACSADSLGLTGKLLDITFEFVSLILMPAVGMLMVLCSLLVHVSGTFLNYIIYFSIVNMADNLKSMDVINYAWGTVRDLANMGFIFILLYAAIRSITGKDTGVQQLIVRMVVAAILINFSLFFTKVIIDLSNIVAVTFYEAAAPGAGNSPLSFGMAGSITDLLGITTLYKSAVTLDPSTVVTMGIMGSIVMLISAFVFFGMAMMLTIRFVTLIFVLVLSPLAFVSNIFPGVSKYGEQWKNALIGQAFFAPVFFFMMWLTIYLAGGVRSVLYPSGISSDAWVKVFTSSGFQATNGVAASSSDSAITVVMLYTIVITATVGSLVISKNIANMSPAMVKDFTKWATGAASAGVSKFSRGTVGRYAQSAVDDKDLRARALRGDKLARLKLAAAEKTSKSSLDFRNAPLGLGKTLDGGQAQKGGFAKDLKDKNKKIEELAKSLAATPEEKAEHGKKLLAAQKTEKDEGKKLDDARKEAKEKSENIVAESEDLKNAEEKVKVAEERVNDPQNFNDLGARADLDEARAEATRLKGLQETETARLRKEFVDTQHKEASWEAAQAEDERRTIEKKGNAGQQRVDLAIEGREANVARLKKWWYPHVDRVGMVGSVKREEEDAVKTIRKATKQKTEEEEAVEAMKKLAQKQAKENKTKEGETAEEQKTPTPPENKPKPTDETV